MSLSGDRLARAEQRSRAARARLRATAGQLRDRLRPRHLLADALDEARRIGETGTERARRHPFIVAGVIALLSGLVFGGRRKATAAASRSLPTERAEPRRSRRSR